MSVSFSKYQAKYGGVSQKSMTVEIASIKEKVAQNGNKYYVVAGKNKFGEMEYFTAFLDKLAKVEATEDDMAPGKIVDIGYVEKQSNSGKPFRNLRSCRPVRDESVKPQALKTKSNDLSDEETAKLIDAMTI